MDQVDRRDFVSRAAEPKTAGKTPPRQRRQRRADRDRSTLIHSFSHFMIPDTISCFSGLSLEWEVW